MKNQRNIVSLITMLVLSAISLSSYSVNLEVTKGYIKETPPGITSSAAYFTIKNPTNSTVKLVGVEGDYATSVELHNHVKKEGVMTMLAVSELAIEPNSTVTLQAGGYHVMIMGLNKPLKKGDEENITLIYDNGHRQMIKLPIISLKEALGNTPSDHPANKHNSH